MPDDHQAMEDAFANLGDIHDEQTLESLFESSSTFANVSLLHASVRPQRKPNLSGKRAMTDD